MPRVFSQQSEKATRNAILEKNVFHQKVFLGTYTAVSTARPETIRPKAETISVKVRKLKQRS